MILVVRVNHRTNPKLLDQLALEFFENDWDVRHLIRCIVTSHAYRMSSNAPPNMLKSES